MTNYTQSGGHAPNELKCSERMRTDSDKKYICKADPNPSQKTRKRVSVFEHKKFKLFAQNVHSIHAGGGKTANLKFKLYKLYAYK